MVAWNSLSRLSSLNDPRGGRTGVESLVFSAVRVRVVSAFLLTALLSPALLMAGEPTAVRRVAAKPVFPSIVEPRCRPQDQIWLVSSRGIGCASSCSAGDPQLQYSQYVDGRWFPSTLELLLASDDPSVATTVYSHGNQVTSVDAKSMGISAYRQVVKKANDPAPLRFIIWSWPSERIPGILRDVRIKAERANGEGYYLAWLIDRMRPDVRVTLMGYSYGSRVVTGALHVLGGGQVAGKTLVERVNPERTPLKAVLMAAAVNNDWLLPGHKHGLALTQVDQLLLLNNPCDRVLRRYRFVSPDRPQALGYTGLPMTASLAPHKHKIKQVNICERQHDWTSYLFSPRLVDLIEPLAFWEWPVLNGN